MISNLEIQTDDEKQFLQCIKLLVGPWPAHTIYSYSINEKNGIEFSSKETKEFSIPLTAEAIFEISKSYIHREKKNLAVPDFDGSTQIGYHLATIIRGHGPTFCVMPTWILYGK